MHAAAAASLRRGDGALRGHGKAAEEVQVEHIRLTPCVESTYLCFNSLESELCFQSHWFQNKISKKKPRWCVRPQHRPYVVETSGRRVSKTDIIDRLQVGGGDE